MRGRIPGLRRLFRLDVLRPDVERDVDEELAFHFDAAVAELERRGVAPAAARAEAERRFGDVRRYRARLAAIDRAAHRDRRRGATWEAVIHDVRYAARALVRRPAFSLSIVVMLALGIGANATMFGVVDRLMLRPPPHVVAPDELRFVTVASPPMPPGMDMLGGFSHALLRDLSASLAGLAEVGAAADLPMPIGPGNMTLGAGPEARAVHGIAVSGSYLAMLGVRPVLGRLLQPSDESPAGATPAAVIGHALWQREFDGAGDVLGRPLRVDGAWYEVAGVLPPDFRGVVHVTPDVWLPLAPALDAAARRAGAGGPPRLFFLARLHAGVTETMAEARASIALAEERPTAPAGTRAGGAELLPLTRQLGVVGSKDRPVAALLAAMSAVLLLVAVVSVANLLLARGLERGREIAVRVTLGVSRRRLVLQLLVESLLLAAAGGAAALLVVQWGSLALQRLLLGAAGATERPVDLRLLAFTGAVVLVVALLAGLVPALQASRPSLLGALRRGVQEGGGRRAASRAMLAAAQSALCVLLLVGAGLFLRSLREVHAVPLGFDAERTLVGSYDLREVGYDTTGVHALFETVAARVRRAPGVRAVAISQGIPLGIAQGWPVSVDGSTADDPDRAYATVYHVSPDYHAAIDLDLLRGRWFGDDDRAGGERVAVVSARMVREHWPDGNAIGRCIRVGADTTPCLTVVGVVEDAVVMQVTEEPMPPQLYVPLAQARKRRDLALSVRVAPDADPRAVGTAVRRLMQGAAPNLPFADVSTLGDELDAELRPWRLGAALFGVFAVIALVTATVGLYGVLAFGVAQRRHEIGVRLALGATAARAMRLVVRQGLLVAAGGILVGVLLALAGAPLVADLLYRTAPTDPVVFGGVVAVLMLVACAASAIPAWRASRVPPAEALRAD